AAGPGLSPGYLAQSAGRDWSHRIPSAAVFYDPSGTRLLAHSAAGPGLGRQCVCGRAHRGCAYPPPAQSPGQCARASDPDRARHWLPLLHQSVLSHAAQLAHGGAMAAGHSAANRPVGISAESAVASRQHRTVTDIGMAAVANAPPAAPVTAGHPNTTSATRRLMGIA